MYANIHTGRVEGIAQIIVFLRRLIAHDLSVVVMHISGIKQRCTAEGCSTEQQGNETSLSNIYSVGTTEYRLRSKY